MAIFNQKWPNVCKIIDFRCSRYGWSRDETAEATQYAGVFLWKHCLRRANLPNGAATINCVWPARVGIRRTLRNHRGARISLDALAEAYDYAPPGRASQDREWAEARIDHPDETALMVELTQTGIDAAEVRRRLGVSKQRVNAIAKRLGGVFIAGRWLFPANCCEDRPKHEPKPKPAKPANGCVLVPVTCSWQTA
jgi:hypothetical protein